MECSSSLVETMERYQSNMFDVSDVRLREKLHDATSCRALAAVPREGEQIVFQVDEKVICYGRSDEIDDGVLLP